MNGEPDKALHYIMGAWGESIRAGLGADAGMLKEWLDRKFGIGQSDENDYRATVDGANQYRRYKHEETPEHIRFK